VRQVVLKTFDQKLERIRTQPGANDFILADAKDADMAFGIAAPGRFQTPAGHERFRSLQEYRQQIREITAQGLVDIMLMSASTSDRLAGVECLFDNSAVTPAIRANDTTDIWLAGTGASYGATPSLPFRSASIDHTWGTLADSSAKVQKSSVNLGLYSVTLNNNSAHDAATLTAYCEFRAEAVRKGFRHFLEVFAPNVEGAVAPEKVPRFVNDSIARLLAGVAAAERPLFLKIPYFGAKWLAELAAYDSELVIGVLGGSAGTTRDAFQLLADAKQQGARAALFGRKINAAEHQLSFVRVLRLVADGELESAEAVRLYHAQLAKLGVRPQRSLDEDLKLTPSTFRY
jgi:hypothetical protein